MAVQADGEGYHGRFDWQQHGEQMDLAVSGPFSQGGVRLTGDASGVQLRDDKGGSAFAVDADALLQQATGLQVPVGGLRYWMLGLPAPGAAPGQAGAQATGPTAMHEVDAQGRLLRLHQNGWNIDYRAYLDVDGLSLPRKLFLDRDDLRVRLVVEQWRR